MAQRVEITLTVVLADGADMYEAAEQVFDQVAADPLGLSPLVVETENYDVDLVPTQ